MNRDGITRISTSLGYLSAARGRSNLTIQPDVRSDVCCSTTNGRWAWNWPGRGGRAVHGRRIVLSAGAIASPAILLRSGIGPAADLGTLGIEVRRDLPGVGSQLGPPRGPDQARAQTRSMRPWS